MWLSFFFICILYYGDIFLGQKVFWVANIELHTFILISFSFYHDTILTRAYIDPPTFIALEYCWINYYFAENTATECSINKNTVSNYFSSFRDSAMGSNLWLVFAGIYRKTKEASLIVSDRTPNAITWNIKFHCTYLNYSLRLMTIIHQNWCDWRKKLQWFMGQSFKEFC